MIRKKKNYMLGEELIRRGLATLEQLDHAIQIQKKTGEFLGQILVRFGYLSETKLVEVLADQFELPMVDPAKAVIHKNILDRVPPKVAQHYHVFPVQMVDKNLIIAIDEPPDFDELQELQAILGTDIRLALAERHKIEEAIRKHYGVGASIVEKLTQAKKDGDDVVKKTSEVEQTESTAGEGSIRELVNQLMIDAKKKRASDIHIEPFPDQLRVRYRVDGILEEAKMPDEIVRFHSSIISRIKIMAHLDISEHRLPQDGRIKIKVQNEELDLRVSLLPTEFGESLVIRILSPTKLLSLEKIGLSDSHLKQLKEVIVKPYGIILLTGPTGSGKTTTLYACLTGLNTIGRKIVTVEDPVEYQLNGIIQMQVHPKIGLTFARGLRHMLRHDPDVMMVGEIRDAETAEIAVRSSMTGHLVFSTLHTNDAISAVIRLADLGIPPYLVGSSLECVIAQRLVRMICPTCKKKEGNAFKGAGCDKCEGTGYYGRNAIHEILVLDEELKTLVSQRISASDLREAAIKKGMHNLREDGLEKVRKGLTTEAEVLRVT